MSASFLIGLLSLAIASTPATAGMPPAQERSSGQSPAATPGDAGEAEVAQWLVDLARHQGHLIGRTDPRTASLHVLALLEAATRVWPECAEAHYWKYDLLGRLGQGDAARQALAEYVRLTPDDDTARLLLLELEIGTLQTASERAAYIQKRLTAARAEADRSTGSETKGSSRLRPADATAPNRSRVFVSDLHRRLARHYYERKQDLDAGREVEHALRLNPWNLAAREIAYDLFGETEPTLQRVELALQLIACNPTQTNLLWELGELLDQLSLHRHAQEWYRRAVALHRQSGVGPAPPTFQHQLALSYLSSGGDEQAVEAADAALAQAPNRHSTRLLRAGALTRLGRKEAAQADHEAVAAAMGDIWRRFEATQPSSSVAPSGTHPQGPPTTETPPAPGELAEAAWYYAYHRPDASRALPLAEKAAARSTASSLARLALGYALRLDGRTLQAVRVLEPLAEVDQMAALELARCHVDLNDQARAITLLHKAATLQYSGIGYEQIKALLALYDETAPEPPSQPKIVAALERFDRRVLDFHKRPEEFLDFRLRFASDPIPAVGPVRVHVRLKNIGPFSIPLGEGFMARPLVSVSARLSGRKPGPPAAEYRNYLQVLLNSRAVLLPGDWMEKTLSIDVGPMRERLTGAAHVEETIEVRALFDPVCADGELTAGLGTLAANVIQGPRPALDFSPGGCARIAAQAGSADIDARRHAADAIGAMLASAEREAPRPLMTEADQAALRTALATLLSDPAPAVRAHALVACGWSTLDQRLTVAASPAVRDDDFVVRLLAVRLFAEQQGEKFKKVLEALSTTDRDGCVRTMARSYLPPEPRTDGAVGRADTEEP